MLTATLRQVAVNFRALSGLSNTSSANLTGYWREIALSAEELAGAATAANATLAGWMLRAAIAVETLEGTDGTAENRNYNGLLKRIVDAMEEGNGAVGTGSLENRLLLASNDWTGGAAGDPNLDTALIAPGFTLVSAQDAYPPEFDITIDASLDVEVLSIRLQGGDEDFSTLAVDQEIDPIGSGVLDFTDLAGVTTGEHFFRCRIENGTMYGPWSLVRKHGDTTAPTITSSASASAVEGVVNPTGTATADETVAWEISGGADAGLVTIDADTGEWVINETTDYDFGQHTYVFDISCTDLAGNVSDPQTFNYTVTNNAADDPDPAWSTIRKDAAITLSNSNFTASCAYAAGMMPVECNTARSAAATSKFYATTDFHVDGSNAYFGFDYAGATLGAFNLGYFKIGPWGWEMYLGASLVAQDYTGGYVDGIVVGVERVGLDMTVKLNGVAVTGPHTLATGSGDLVGIFGGTNMYACTADFTDY